MAGEVSGQALTVATRIHRPHATIDPFVN